MESMTPYTKPHSTMKLYHRHDSLKDKWPKPLISFWLAAAYMYDLRSGFQHTWENCINQWSFYAELHFLKINKYACNSWRTITLQRAYGQEDRAIVNTKLIPDTLMSNKHTLPTSIQKQLCWMQVKHLSDWCLRCQVILITGWTRTMTSRNSCRIWQTRITGKRRIVSHCRRRSSLGRVGSIIDHRVL